MQDTILKTAMITRTSANTKTWRLMHTRPLGTTMSSLITKNEKKLHCGQRDGRHRAVLEGVRGPYDDNVEEEAVPSVESDVNGRAIEGEMDGGYGARSGRYGLRARKKPGPTPSKFRNYGHSSFVQVLLVHTDTSFIPPSFDAHSLSPGGAPTAPVVDSILTSYGVKNGIQLFGKDGDDAVCKEILQLHNRRVMRPRHPSSIPTTKRSDAPHYLMFIKQKRDGNYQGLGMPGLQKAAQLHCET